MSKKLNVVASPTVTTTTVAKKAPAPKKVKDTAISMSRTKLVNMVHNSKGKPFKAIAIGKDGKEHTISGIRYKKQNDPMGYIQVYSTSAKEMRLLNPQTLLHLRYAKVDYKASSKPKLVSQP